MLSERKRLYDIKYQRENTVMLTVRLHKQGDKDIIDALEKFSVQYGVSKGAAVKQLIRGQMFIV